jgi:hypothetical protein
MVTALLFTSSFIFLFEHEAQPDKFGSIPESMWWSIATLTTVGYWQPPALHHGDWQEIKQKTFGTSDIHRPGS